MARATMAPDADLRAALDEALAGRRAVLTRGPLRIAVVPQDDLDRLEELDRLEDEMDAAAGAAAWEEAVANGDEGISADELFRELGLE